MLALYYNGVLFLFFFFFQAEDGIRDKLVTGVQTCALPICVRKAALCQVTFGQLADEATDMSEVELLSGPHASRFTNTDIRTHQLVGHLPQGTASDAALEHALGQSKQEHRVPPLTLRRGVTRADRIGRTLSPGGDTNGAPSISVRRIAAR